jgi:hypothetical protein
MREYRIELGEESSHGKYTRTHSEPILARFDAEAILIADEVIKRAQRRHALTRALLLRETMAVVKSWPLAGSKSSVGS